MPRAQPQLSFSRQASWHEDEVATAPLPPPHRSAAPAWGNVGGSSPRRVTFAVQNVPPSPVVYHAHSQSDPARELRGTRFESQIEDLGVELHGVRARAPATRQRQRQQARSKQQPMVVRPDRRQVKDPKQVRRPGWNPDVTHGSTLFDGSLKKSLLFQPRAGDRRKEQSAEAQQILSPSLKRETPPKGTPPRRKKFPAPTPTRYRSGPSSVYSQYRQQSTSHRPRHRSKDYVKQNIERVTGRSVRGHATPTKARVESRENVFDRLAAPRVSKALLRHYSPQESGEISEKTTMLSPEPSPGSPARPISPRPSPRSSSPVLTIEPPASEKHDVSFATPYSPSVQELSSQLSSRSSSPQRSQRSQSSRRSSGPRSTSSSRRSNGSESQTHRKKSFPAQVFAVLDRNENKRIGVEQILQGLRLLGLPATHNQISDYVYLVHEGRHSTIDLEEWEILVGTLDAASRPSASSPHNANVGQGSDSSPFAPQSPSSHNTSQPLEARYHRSSPRLDTRSVGSNLPSENPMGAREAATSHPVQEDYQVPSSFRHQTYASTAHQPIQDDDPYLEEIQNRIEGMFQRAEATAALRQTVGVSNNQNEDDILHSRSDRVLKRAATVVYSLRTSLFPLVHQAEATLREIQQRHGSKLSLFLPPADLSAIAQNSDSLASAILDDILMDTVQLLNDEDRQRSHHQMESHHADQLDAILARIQQIEQEEQSMVDQGLALAYSTPGDKCELPMVIPSQQTSQARTTTANEETFHRENLRLPLEVVMNVNNLDKDSRLSRQQIPKKSNSIVEGAPVYQQAPGGVKELQVAAQAQALATSVPVTTAILQGQRLRSIEKRRLKFQRHRRLVEASLAETGMTQCSVIEMLEDMVLDDLVDEAAAELDETVVSLSDALMTNLL